MSTMRLSAFASTAAYEVQLSLAALDANIILLRALFLKNKNSLFTFQIVVCICVGTSFKTVVVHLDCFYT